MPSGKASWYSQFDGRFVWRDLSDKPRSNALGVPDWAQGISLDDRRTLGTWFSVTAPNGVKSIEQQTEIGPAPDTGRTIDISAAAAERFGYSPGDFPTDGAFSWTRVATPDSIVSLHPREQAVAYRQGTAAEPETDWPVHHDAPVEPPTVIGSNKISGDGQFIPHLLDIATNHLEHTQQEAARKELHAVGERYPSDGCAITLSELLEEAGISVRDTYQALALGKALEARGWKRIPPGQQQRGDVGSTCGDTPHHGVDHVYLVLKVLNPSECIVADNQAHVPHIRPVKGGGKSPTTHFLRAI